MLRVTGTNAFYGPGEVVEGTVTLVNEEPLEEFSGFDVILHGGEYSRVTYRSGGDNKSSRSQDLFLDLCCSISDPSMKGPTLAPGEYSFPFSFHLPDVLPFTYDVDWMGKSALLRYLIVGKIHQKESVWAKVKSSATSGWDKHPLASFSVLPSYILPKSTNQQVTTASGSKAFLMSTTSGELQMSFSASPGNAFPGQKITVAIDIKNDSHKDVEAVSLRLESWTLITSGAYWNDCKEILCQSKHDIGAPISCGQSRHLEFDISVPEDTLPGFIHKIVEKNHAIIAQAHVHSKSGYDLEVPLSPYPIGAMEH